VFPGINDKNAAGFRLVGNTGRSRQVSLAYRPHRVALLVQPCHQGEFAVGHHNDAVLTDRDTYRADKFPGAVGLLPSFQGNGFLIENENRSIAPIRHQNAPGIVYRSGLRSIDFTWRFLAANDLQQARQILDRIGALFFRIGNIAVAIKVPNIYVTRHIAILFRRKHQAFGMGGIDIQLECRLFTHTGATGQSDQQDKEKKNWAGWLQVW